MNKKLFRLAAPLFFFGLIILSGCSKKGNESKLQYIKAGANIWQVELSGSKYLATADYDGNVSLRDMKSNKKEWEFPAGAFVFDLKTGDIDQDGRDETVFVTAEGDLVVLDSAGKKKWSFRSALPLYNVGIGNFTGDEKLEVTCGGIDRRVYVFDCNGQLIGKSPEVERLVHRMAVGNLQGDEHDEILVIENRTVANIMGFENDSFQSILRKPLKVPDALINWENPRGNFFPFSIGIDDLDNDGKNEIIMGDTFFNKQAVAVADNNADLKWISEGIPQFQTIDGAQTEFYSTAFVRSADLFDDVPGKEIVSVAAGMFRIFDKEGNLLGERNTKLGFTDFEIDGKNLVLGSCPNGDEYIYKVAIDADWKETVGQLEFQGLIKEIQENSAELSKKVKAYEGEPQSDQVYDLIAGIGSRPSPKGMEIRKKQLNWFQREFPYKNLRPVSNSKVIEETPPLDEKGNPWSTHRWSIDAINGTMTVEQILERAKWIEENEIPTLYLIGHSCMPFITLETAEQILKLAPNYCVGFITAEDEDINVAPRYFEYYYKPLANLCLKYGNKVCITKNKGFWWVTTPSDEHVFNAMFKGGRKEVAMSATEDSNSRTPEMNLMGRGGLWQAGLLTHNDVSIHADLFSYNRFQQWEYPRVGNQYLRLLVAHTTMGMTQISSRIREINYVGDSLSFTSIGKESTEIFYHMLGKGLVFSPNRKDILGYSPIGMVVHKPERKWLEDAHNGHNPELWEDDPELLNGVFLKNGNLWGMTNTPDHAFQKVILNKERQFGYQVPATPYGLVAFVPEQTNLNDVANVHEWWHTDGISVWKENGSKFTGIEAAKALQEDFEKAAEKLPFRQVGDAVFMQIIRMGEDHYRLYLVDTGWINPKEHDVTVRIQLEGDFEVQNSLEQETYAIEDSKFHVHIPAGLFQIVGVTRKH